MTVVAWLAVVEVAVAEIAAVVGSAFVAVVTIVTVAAPCIVGPLDPVIALVPVIPVIGRLSERGAGYQARCRHCEYEGFLDHDVLLYKSGLWGNTTSSESWSRDQCPLPTTSLNRTSVFTNR
ncbi:hypothetical protein LP420_30135 [Massilia sp. B-10]|nr:hypothetical protein LP420_30135 [Massilia sp. B-10]